MSSLTSQAYSPGKLLLAAVLLTCSPFIDSGTTLAAAESADHDAYSIVYTRQPRATDPIPGSVIQDAANWQHATDVARINGGIAEADIVIDNLKGKIEVVHDCTTTAEVCVAHEARVSPDATRIAYSVGYANELRKVKAHGVDLGIKEIGGLTHATIIIYDIKTGKKETVPQPPGVIDRQPEWLDNDTLVFASNRGTAYPPRNQLGFHEDPQRCMWRNVCVSQEYGYGPHGKSMQIWRMNVDGSQAYNLTPHETMALAPSVTTSGDILYSCWNAHGNRSHDTAGAVGPATGKNKWWLCRMDSNGADSTVVLNAHRTPHLKSQGWLDNIGNGSGVTELRAIRSVAEIFKGKLAVTNYYRGNHLGSMGIIFGFDYVDPHIEGCSTARCYRDGNSRSTEPGTGRYIPSTMRALTPYGMDQDASVLRHKNGKVVGKAGYPAPLPHTDKEFMYTHARGQCYEVTKPEKATMQWTGGEPTCQKAIYRAKTDMVTDPFDTSQLEWIAGGLQWHAWDARAIAPYESFYGQNEPDKIPPLNADEACYLGVVDAREAELAPSAPYDWMRTLYRQCNTQGCAVNTEDPAYFERNMHALTIYQIEMWDHSYFGKDKAAFQANMNNMGHKSIAILGSAPIEKDGSLKLRVPCEEPLLMVGTDRNGMKIAHDEMLHSLRPGETRVCHGCHDGHSEERAARIKGTAAERFAKTLAANTYPPLPTPQQPIRFYADVAPILERRCTGCHQDMQGEHLYSRVALDFRQEAFPWIKRKESPKRNYQLARPYTSKWVAKFALDSLLYWKCIGARADGRTDDQYDNDIDFGPAHNSGASAEECKVIGQWIDTGIQN